MRFDVITLYQYWLIIRKIWISRPKHRDAYKERFAPTPKPQTSNFDGSATYDCLAHKRYTEVSNSCMLIVTVRTKINNKLHAIFSHHKPWPLTSAYCVRLWRFEPINSISHRRVPIGRKSNFGDEKRSKPLIKPSSGKLVAIIHFICLPLTVPLTGVYTNWWYSLVLPLDTTHNLTGTGSVMLGVR